MTNEMRPRYLTAGELAIVVEFGDTIDPAIHESVLALDAAVAQANFAGVIETVPTYRSLMIYFDPRLWAARTLIDALTRLDIPPNAAAKRRRRWHIPACYDPPHDEDIAEVADFLGMPRVKHYRIA